MRVAIRSSVRPWMATVAKVVFFAMKDGYAPPEWAEDVKQVLTEKFGEEAFLVFVDQCNGVTVVDVPGG